MVWDELGRDAGDENQRDRDRWIGVYIGALAVILALCSMGGSNSTKDATLKSMEAANTWSFFQAKNIRRHVLRVEVDELELSLKSNPAMPEDARTATQDKIATFKKQIAELTSEPATGEGLDELFKRGKALEADRDMAMKRDPYFDWAQALLQIAIVLGGVIIITGGSTLLWTSVFMGALGTLMTINGFFLLVDLPYFN